MNSLLKFDLADLSETNTQLEIVVNTLEEMYQELNHVQETLAKSSNSLYIEKITNELIPTISTDIDYLSQTLEMNFEHLLTVNYGVNDIFGPREPIEVDYEALSKWTKELELLICDIKKMNKSLILSHVEQEYKNMRSKLETEIQQDKHKLDYAKLKQDSDLLLDLEYNYHMYTEVVEDFMRVNLTNQLMDIQAHVKKIYQLYQFDQECTMKDLLNRQVQITPFKLAQFGEEYMEYKIEHEIMQEKVWQGIKLEEVKPLIIFDIPIRHEYNLKQLKLSEVKIINIRK